MAGTQKHQVLAGETDSEAFLMPTVCASLDSSHRPKHVFPER